MRKARQYNNVRIGRFDKKIASLSLLIKLPCPNYRFQNSCTNWPKKNTLLKFPRWPKPTISILVQREITIATSVATHVTALPSWKDTCWFTAERSLLFAHSATTLAAKLPILESTCEPTQEKSLIVANSATIPAKRQAISRSTCSLIQWKSHFVAINVPPHL